MRRLAMHRPATRGTIRPRTWLPDGERADVADHPAAAWALGVAAGLLLLWLVGLLALLVIAPGRATLVDSLRLLPDLLRLLPRLARDRGLPRGLRIRLSLLLVYLALPIDLVPDVIPVLGWADDLILVTLVLRSVLRVAGPEAVRRHWPGSEEGLAVVLALAGDGRAARRRAGDEA